MVVTRRVWWRWFVASSPQYGEGAQGNPLPCAPDSTVRNRGYKGAVMGWHNEVLDRLDDREAEILEREEGK